MTTGTEVQKTREMTHLNKRIWLGIVIATFAILAGVDHQNFWSSISTGLYGLGALIAGYAMGARDVLRKT